MKAIELVAKENNEVRNKHGFSIEHDQFYKNGELLQAAIFSINPSRFPYSWPDGWIKSFKIKIENKEKIERLVVAASFLLSEIDRLLSLNPTPSKTQK